MEQCGDAALQRRASWRHLFAFTKRNHWGTLCIGIAAACGCAAVRTVYAITLGQVFQIITDYGSGNTGATDTLARTSHWCIIICLLGVGALFANAVLMSSWVVFSELQAKSARKKMFHELLCHDIAWYDRQADGIPSLLVRVETQIRELQRASSQIFGFLITDIISAIASLILAFLHSWKLSLALLATVPLSAIFLTIANRKLELAIDGQKRHLAEASRQVNASVTAISLVKIYNGVNQEVLQYHKTIEASKERYLVQARCNALQIAYIQWWVSSLFVAGFWFGLWLMTEGANAAQILTTFYATLTALQGISDIVPQWMVLVKGMSAGGYLKAMTRGSPAGKQEISEGIVGPRHCVGAVQVKNVSFAYPSNPKQLVLDNASFRFPTGRTSFIVGKSGSGKSTLGSLLVNFYEPLSGDILIDGRPIEALNKTWLRTNVTLVQQSSVIFQGSFFENVAMGHTSPECVSKEGVIKACEMALLQSVLAALPLGMDTIVNPDGHGISGGETQRLALARARLRNPPVLILDEVTSGLDEVSKHLIMEAIRHWRRGKTTIFITHDLSLIGDDDYIYVMDDSRVVQQGTRGALSKETGSLFECLSPFSEDGEGETCSTRASKVESGFFEKPSLFDTRLTPYEDEALRFDRESLKTGAVREYASLRQPSWRDMSIQAQRQDLDATRRSMYGGFRWCASRPGSIANSRWETCGQSLLEIESRKALHSADRTSMEAIQTAGHATQLSRMSSSRQCRQWTNSSKLSNEGYGLREVSGTKQEWESGRDEPRQEEVLSLSAIFRTVWPNLSGRDKFRCIIGLVFAVVAAGCNPVFSYCFAQLLAAFWAASDKLAACQEWALYLILIALISGLSMFLERYFMEHTGQAWVDSLRLEGMKRILQQPKPWFDKIENSATRISQTLDHDAEEMRNLVGRFASITLMVIVMAAVSMIWSLTISWKLTLVALSSIPVILAAIKPLSMTSTKWESVCSEEAIKTASVIKDCVVNIRFTRAFTLERYFGQRHARSAVSTYKVGLQRGLRTGPLFGINQSIDFFVIALVFWYGTYLAFGRAELSATSLQQVVNLLLFCVGQASAMICFIPQVSASQAAATRMLRFANMTVEEEPSRRCGRRVLNSLFPIEMRHLSFEYSSRPTHRVLHDVSLQLDAGKCTAIVGPSGCGKSTIISLLMGLYRPTQALSAARLTYAGISSDRVIREHLCAMISFVPQKPFLFPATVAENIMYGLAEASPLRHVDNLERAARAAGIHDFITSLPQGYHTIVGDGGQTLSGGQSQRICIARALARRPRLLVMDEPTSGLDGRTAELIRQTIRSVLGDQEQGGTSVLIVTHSREMMRVSDHLVVVEDGRVVEQGGFDELRLRGNMLSTLSICD